MPITVTTWNINSVRLRINLVAKFIKAVRPDVLCLQETKCPDDRFRSSASSGWVTSTSRSTARRAITASSCSRGCRSRAIDVQGFCGKTDCRHISVVLGERAGLRDPITLHNFYVPGRRRHSRSRGQSRNSPTSSPSSTRCAITTMLQARTAPSARSCVGDLNVAPLEHDVWSHKQMLRVVSHTPIECEKLIAAQKPAAGSTHARSFVPEPAKLYTWWSYRAPDWATADKGRRLDHIWTSPMLADRVSGIRISRTYRGAERPSDHVPVTATIEVY